MNKQRKQSMREVVDQHSPTYKRAVAAIDALVGDPLHKRTPAEAPTFFRGARVKQK